MKKPLTRLERISAELGELEMEASTAGFDGLADELGEMAELIDDIQEGLATLTA